MSNPESDDLGATAQAALVRTGESSPDKPREAAIQRIEARDPAQNAVLCKPARLRPLRRPC